MYQLDIHGNAYPSWRADNLRRSDYNYYDKKFNNYMMPKQSGSFSIIRLLQMPDDAQSVTAHFRGQALPYSQVWMQSDGSPIGGASYTLDNSITTPITFPITISIPGRILTWQSEGNLMRLGRDLIDPLRFTLTIMK
jgi:hypothetical protein